MMRQAGRYLPEYRQVRKTAGSFLDLCYSPDLAVEVTLQPIRRFGFDAAILFSDILVVPHALGRDLRFEEGRGPLMTPIDVDGIFWLESGGAADRLEPVYETVRLLRQQLPTETTLLGFCGAPWTVATYMIAGHGTPDQAPARLFAYRNAEAFQKLLDVLADVSAEYLIRQIDAGADAVQIFDSWAGVLDEACFEQFCVAPVARIVKKVRAVHPGVPLSVFRRVQARSMSITGSVPALPRSDWIGQCRFPWRLHCKAVVRFREILIHLRVVAGGRALDEGVDAILDSLGHGPLIFNLGHGITPDAPVSHVEQMVNRVRQAAIRDNSTEGNSA